MLGLLLHPLCSRGGSAGKQIPRYAWDHRASLGEEAPPPFLRKYEIRSSYGRKSRSLVAAARRTHAGSGWQERQCVNGRRSIPELTSCIVAAIEAIIKKIKYTER
jgi:hypothetical protein